MLVSFVAFFLLGFLFYASLYASIGAAVNTVQEAQNFVFPVILPLIVGLVCFPVVLESPDGAVSVVLLGRVDVVAGSLAPHVVLETCRTGVDVTW